MQRGHGGHLDEHAVAVRACAEAFGADHDLEELGFDGMPQRGERGGAAVMDVEDACPELAQSSFDLVGAVVEEEADGVDEVAVVVVVLVVAAGEHLVRRGAEQERLVAGELEERLGELAGRVLA